MAQMTQQGAVGLAHGGTHPFAGGVVGLFNVECDDAVGVAGHHHRAVGQRTQKVKRQAVFGVVRFFGAYGQAQRQQLGYKPAFGQLDLAPQDLVFGVVLDGDGAVQAAGQAQRGGAVGVHQPVAARCGVEVRAAHELGATGGAVHRPGAGLCAFLQRHNPRRGGLVAQGGVAGQACTVAKENPALTLAGVRAASGGLALARFAQVAGDAVHNRFEELHGRKFRL